MSFCGGWCLRSWCLFLASLLLVTAGRGVDGAIAVAVDGGAVATAAGMWFSRTAFCSRSCAFFRLTPKLGSELTVRCPRQQYFINPIVFFLMHLPPPASSFVVLLPPCPLLCSCLARWCCFCSWMVRLVLMVPYWWRFFFVAPCWGRFFVFAVNQPRQRLGCRRLD